MNARKLYLGLCTLLVLLGLAVLFSAREADLLLDKQSKTLLDLKAKDQATVAQQTQLTQDKKDIATYSGLNTIAKSIVPQDKDQAEAVREIVALATQSGIKQLSSIAFPSSTLGTTTTTKTAKGITQVTPVKGIAGVYDLQITITQDSGDPVPYGNFTNFLARLEQNRRTADVTSVTVTPDQTTPSQVAFTLIVDEFIKP